MSAPLDGVRIVEFAQVIAVPVGMQLLRSLGAEVIKVEPPAGDAIRVSRSSGVRGEGRLFLLHNRGKRSVTVDLGHPDAAEVVAALVETADVVATSFKRTDLPRYGLTYDAIRAIKPDIVYLENTPYGPEGPLADMGGYDPVVGGISGISFLAAADERGAPRLVLPAMNDFGTACLAALGIVAAIRQRDLTGEGQKVETSLLATAMMFGSQAANWVEDHDPQRVEQLDRDLADARAAGAGFDEQRTVWERSFRPDTRGNIFFRHYRCSDGFITVACLSDGLRAKLRAAIPIEDPRTRDDWDPTAPDAGDRLDRMVLGYEAHFAARPCAEWLDELDERGIPCGPFQHAEAAIFDPQVEANGFIEATEHPTVGTFRAYAPPVRLSANGAKPLGHSPLLGADTDDVLATTGLAGADIERLRRSGALG